MRRPSAPLGAAAPAAVLVAVLVATLAGCGDDDGRGADEAPSGSAGSTASTPAPHAPDASWRLVGIVHETAAGGSSSATLTRLDDAADVTRFGAQFERPDLGQQVVDLVAAHPPPDGHVLAAAVLSIGCDVPPGVAYADGRVTPHKVASPLDTCYAPVTSVAVLEVPEGEVPEESGGGVTGGGR